MEFVIALVLFSLAFAGLALGVIFGKKQVSGSCGGDVRDKSGHVVVSGNCACGRKEADLCETDNLMVKYAQVNLVEKHPH